MQDMVSILSKNSISSCMEALDDPKYLYCGTFVPVVERTIASTKFHMLYVSCLHTHELGYQCKLI